MLAYKAMQGARGAGGNSYGHYPCHSCLGEIVSGQFPSADAFLIWVICHFYRTAKTELDNSSNSYDQECV